MSPAATRTVPVVVPPASSAIRTACPVPFWSSWTARVTSGISAWMWGPTWSRWCPTTATTRVGSSAWTAASTWPTMLRPPISCSTLAVFDLMRVPPPAASTITVRSVAMGTNLIPATGAPTIVREEDQPVATTLLSWVASSRGSRDRRGPRRWWRTRRPRHEHGTPLSDAQPTCSDAVAGPNLVAFPGWSAGRARLTLNQD